jgi:hypothetical protein
VKAWLWLVWDDEAAPEAEPWLGGIVRLELARVAVSVLALTGVAVSTLASAVGMNAALASPAVAMSTLDSPQVGVSILTAVTVTGGGQ